MLMSPNGRGPCATRIDVATDKALFEALQSVVKKNAYVLRSASADQERINTHCKEAGLDDAEFVLLETTQLNKIKEHIVADQVISVQTGISLRELDRVLRQSSQWLPVSFCNDKTSLADVIDTGDGGALETMSGGPRGLVLGMELALSSGQAIKTGGKIVKNVTGYDLSKLFIGAQSWLAVPYLVHLRLFARPESEEFVLAVDQDPLNLLRLARPILNSGMPVTGLEICDFRLIDLILESEHLEDTLRQSLLRARTLIKSDGANIAPAIMVLSTHGQARLCKTTCEFFRDYLGKNSIKTIAPANEDLSNLARALGCMDILPAGSALEIVATMSMLGKVLARLRLTEPRPIFTIRPQMGRLKLFSNSSRYQDQERWKQLIVKESSTESAAFTQSLIVSYSTPAYSHVVEHLGAGREADRLASLKKSLKNKFDPANRLNPLVRFF